MTPDQTRQAIRLLIEEDDIVRCDPDFLNQRITELSTIVDRESDKRTKIIID